MENPGYISIFPFPVQFDLINIVVNFENTVPSSTASVIRLLPFLFLFNLHYHDYGAVRCYFPPFLSPVRPSEILKYNQYVSSLLKGSTAATYTPLRTQLYLYSFNIRAWSQGVVSFYIVECIYLHIVSAQTSPRLGDVSFSRMLFERLRP